MKDFFISYNKADRPWAEWIAWQLEEAGYSIIIQTWDFRPGQNFVLAMDRAIKESTQTIAVLSPDYLAAFFTHSEWAAAFLKDPMGLQRTLWPIRVRECSPTGLLAPIVYTDLVDCDERTAVEKILAAATEERGKPKSKPHFPDAEHTVRKPLAFPSNHPNQFPQSSEVNQSESTRNTRPAATADQLTGSGRMRGPRIPARLLNSIRSTLSACGQLGSDAQLSAIFSSAELKPWQAGLPSAPNIAARVDLVVDYLLNRFRTDGQNALILLLKELSYRYDPDDELHGRLLGLIGELEQSNE